MFDVYRTARNVKSGGIEITVTDHGPGDGEAVLLIHGFPDSARLWRNQIPALTEAGYRVLAPDMRGFGRSDAPEPVSEYHMTLLAADMVRVLEEAGVRRAHVVGHDFGAWTAWTLALRAPDMVKTMTAVSVGHPGAFQTAGLRQRQLSWYTLLFQFEEIAERWLSDDDWFWLRRWSGSDEVETWISDLSRPGRLTASLNLYRANMPPKSLLAKPREHPQIQVPVMGVWSTGDVALTERQMTASGDFVSGGWRYEQIEDVGHWIPLDAPERLNELLLDWLSGV